MEQGAIKELILLKYVNLRKSERKVADYMLSYNDEIEVLSLKK